MFHTYVTKLVENLLAGKLVNPVEVGSLSLDLFIGLYIYTCVGIQPIKVGECFESINATPKFCSTSKNDEDNFLLVQSQMASNTFGCGRSVLFDMYTYVYVPGSELPSFAYNRRWSSTQESGFTYPL